MVNKFLPLVMGAIYAQTIIDPSTTAWERILEKGSMFSVICILLYFYRRDTKWATEFWKDQTINNAELIASIAKSQADLSHAIQENTIVTHATKNFMREYLHFRRDSDRHAEVGGVVLGQG